MAVGLTLIVAYHPRLVLEDMQAKGLTVYPRHESGKLEDGTMFRVVRPIQITQAFLSGLHLRKVILKRNIAITPEQVELLKSRRRAIIRGDFISVE